MTSYLGLFYSIPNGQTDLEISLEIRRFVNEAQPRLEANLNNDAVGYSASGAVVLRGRNHTPKHLWTIEALLTTEDKLKLETIWILWDSARRNAGGLNLADRPAITVIDRTTPITEPGLTYSRQPIAGTVPQEILPGLWRYYAVFEAVPTAAPEFRKQGKFWAANFTLQETYPVPPIEE